MMRITVLVENTVSDNQNLKAEHGLSLLVEYQDLCLLYDTGQTSVSFENAQTLGLDPAKITHVILSHGHYDHTNGLPAWLPHLRKEVPIFIGKNFLIPKYSVTESEERYLGCNFTRQDLFPHPIIEVENSIFELSSNVFLIKNFNHAITSHPISTRFKLKPTEQGFVQDFFREELALVFLCQHGLFLMSGCSHNGILNIRRSCEQRLKTSTIAVFGGIHLSKASPKEIEKVSRLLFDIPNLALCHCSGSAVQQQTESIAVATGAQYTFDGESLIRK